MNAYTPPQRPAPSEDTVQHMRMLRRLAELGMELAEIAAEEAKTVLTDPAPQPAEPEAEAPAPRAKDPILAFTRLSRIVTQAIKLHTEMESGAKSSTTLVEQFADPRRRFLQEAITDMANNNPDLEFTAAEAFDAIEIRLAKDPAEFATLRTILRAVVNDLGLPPNPKLSAHVESLIARLSGEPREDPPERSDWYMPALQ